MRRRNPRALGIPPWGRTALRSNVVGAEDDERRQANLQQIVAANPPPRESSSSQHRKRSYHTSDEEEQDKEEEEEQADHDMSPSPEPQPARATNAREIFEKEEADEFEGQKDVEIAPAVLRGFESVAPEQRGRGGQNACAQESSMHRGNSEGIEFSYGGGLRAVLKLRDHKRVRKQPSKQLVSNISPVSSRSISEASLEEQEEEEGDEFDGQEDVEMDHSVREESDAPEERGRDARNAQAREGGTQGGNARGIGSVYPGKHLRAVLKLHEAPHEYRKGVRGKPFKRIRETSNISPVSSTSSSTESSFEEEEEEGDEFDTQTEEEEEEGDESDAQEDEEVGYGQEYVETSESAAPEQTGRRAQNARARRSGGDGGVQRGNSHLRRAVMELHEGAHDRQGETFAGSKVVTQSDINRLFRFSIPKGVVEQLKTLGLTLTESRIYLILDEQDNEYYLAFKPWSNCPVLSGPDWTKFVKAHNLALEDVIHVYIITRRQDTLRFIKAALSPPN